MCKFARMNWDDVRVLMALLEARNLHGAGKRLRMDRSTVSRRLTALEGELGTRLFVRTREGLRPTPAVERVRPFAEAMAMGASGLQQAIQSQAEDPAGVVRVATNEVVATLLVECGLLDLRQRYAELSIELLSSNLPADLLRGEADVALSLSPVRMTSLRIRTVARLGVGLYAAPSYLRRRGRPTEAAALEGHSLILPGGDLAQLPEARWLEARKGVRIALRSNSLPALQSAAVSGYGLAPMTLAWGDRDTRLERVLVLDQIPERTVRLVTPPVAVTRSAVRAVADRIAEIFHGLQTLQRARSR